MLLAIALEPLSQLLVAYRSQRYLEPGVKATVPTLNSWIEQPALNGRVLFQAQGAPSPSVWRTPFRRVYSVGTSRSQTSSLNARQRSAASNHTGRWRCALLSRTSAPTSCGRTYTSMVLSANPRRLATTSQNDNTLRKAKYSGWLLPRQEPRGSMSSTSTALLLEANRTRLLMYTSCLRPAWTPGSNTLTAHWNLWSNGE